MIFATPTEIVPASAWADAFVTHVRKNTVHRQIILPLPEILEQRDPNLLRWWLSDDQNNDVAASIHYALKNCLHFYTQFGWEVLTRIDKNNMFISILEATWDRHTGVSRDSQEYFLFKTLIPYMLAVSPGDDQMLDSAEFNRTLGSDVVIDLSFVKVY